MRAVIKGEIAQLDMLPGRWLPSIDLGTEYELEYWFDTELTPPEHFSLIGDIWGWGPGYHVPIRLTGSVGRFELNTDNGVQVPVKNDNAEEIRIETGGSTLSNGRIEHSIPVLTMSLANSTGTAFVSTMLPDGAPPIGLFSDSSMHLDLNYHPHGDIYGNIESFAITPARRDRPGPWSAPFARASFVPKQATWLLLSAGLLTITCEGRRCQWGEAS